MPHNKTIHRTTYNSRRHRFWGWCLALLLVSGSHRSGGKIDGGSGPLGWILRLLIPHGFVALGPVVVGALKCRQDRCRPDCSCKLDDEAQCAADYGNWGWIPYNDSAKEVWKALRPRYKLRHGAIKPVGMRGDANRVTGIGRGIGKIVEITDEKLVGDVYFEMRADQLGTPDENKTYWDQYNTPNLIVEIYGGIEFGLKDCSSEGIMLGHRLINMTGYNDYVSNFEYSVAPLDDEYNEMFLKEAIECHPRAMNARVVVVRFTLRDPFYYNEENPSIMNLWYPFRQNLEFGSMEFCIHIEMIDPAFESADDDFTDDYFKKKNVTSFLDTKFKVEVSAPEETNNFTRFQEDFSEVKVYSNQPYTPNNETTLFLPKRYNETKPDNKKKGKKKPKVQQIEVPLTTVLCSSPWESDVPGSFDPDRTFFFGQTFRLCLGIPKNSKYYTMFRITGFRNIVCQNNNRTTTLIDPAGIPSPYTTIEPDTLGFTVYKGGIITNGNDFVSINSWIDSDLAGIFPTGAKFFVCSGTVLLDEIPVFGEEELYEEFLEEIVEEEDISDTTSDAANSTDVASTKSLPANATNTTGSNGRRRQRQRQRRRRTATGSILPSSRYDHHRRHYHQRWLQDEETAGEDNIFEETDSDNDNDNDSDNDSDSDNATTTLAPSSAPTKTPEPLIEIIGDLAIRVDITQDTTMAKMEGAFEKSIDTVSGWFKKSSAANAKPPSLVLLLLSSVFLVTTLAVIP